MKDDLTGREAITYAAQHPHLQLWAHGDPTGATERPISADEASELAAIDPALVFLPDDPYARMGGKCPKCGGELCKFSPGGNGRAACDPCGTYWD